MARTQPLDVFERVHKTSTWRPRWWSHRCNPLAVPSNGTAVRLACEPTPAGDTRKFQCYISQVRRSVQCHKLGHAT
jgi:hypothetical protein